MRLYVDFNDAGHHPRHVEQILQLESGRVLTSCSALNRVSREILESTRVEVIAIDISPQDFRQHVSALRKALEQMGDVTSCIHLAIDDVFVPLCRSIAGKPMPVFVEGVWMSCNTFYTRHTKRSSFWKFMIVQFAWSYYLSGASLRGVHGALRFLNEELTAWLTEGGWLAKNAVRWIADPPDVHARVRKGVRSHRGGCVPVVAFLGVHNARKGTLWALNALTEWSGPAIKVLIAGKWRQAANIATVVSRLPSSVTYELRDYVLSTAEWNDALETASVVCAPYVGFGGSSGIVGNALCSHIPVLVSDFGVLGRRVRMVSEDMIFRELDEESFREKLALLLEAEGKNWDFTSYNERHSSQRYLSEIARGLESCLKCVTI